MAQFNLENYETVADRLVRWWEEYPDGQILTSIHHYQGDVVLFRAEGYDNNGKLIATGYAEEIRGSSPVNRTSFVENGETSAIGRMIANSPLGHTGERPSRTEMMKASSHPAVVSSNKPEYARTTQQVVNELADKFGATEVKSDPPSIKNPGEPASPKQLGMLRAILRGMEIENQDAVDLCGATIGRIIEKMDELTKGEASELITKFKQ
jgi:hypothetical protein